MPVTSELIFQPGICNGIKKDGKPCTMAAMPGSLRCKFHPQNKYPDSYAEPPAGYLEQIAQQPQVTPPAAVAAPSPSPGAKIAEALAAVDDPEEFRLPADVRYGADIYPEPEENASAGASAPQASAIPEGFEERWVIDDGEYVKRLVSIASAPVYDRSPDQHHDGFELGRAYFQGEHAEFDYRWINEDAKLNLPDRKNGFLPVKKPLDNLHHAENGSVRMGDLILARRPKDVTRERAREHARTQERIVGEVDEYKQAGAALGVETFGSITASEDRFQGDVDPEEVRHARQRAQQVAEPPRGRRSFGPFNLPFQRDLVAERHGAVGGS